MLKAEEAPTIIPTKYSDYTDVFLPKLTIKLLEYIGINNHIIKLEKNKQPSYGPIYSLDSVKLETLKAYIEINLANSFIKLFKSPTGASIFFNCKLNKSLYLYVDYFGLNNLTIKN